MAVYTRINAIAFDIGGVLIEIDQAPIRLLLFAYKKTPKDFFDEEFILLQRGLINPEEFFVSKCKKIGIPREKLREAFIKMIPPERSELVPHFPYFFASNINQLHFEIFVKKFNPSLFCREHSLLSYEIGHLKPSKKFFGKLARKSLRPNTVLFIDDKIENIKAAKSCGIPAILCLGPKNLPGLLSRIFSDHQNVRRSFYVVKKTIPTDCAADTF